MQQIDELIDRKIGEVRTDALDLSFGEILNLYLNHELVIQPEYQRLFRWTDEQRSRLIESILLELPVPPIFVLEGESGVFELIDGLQRVSSMIQFMEPSILHLDPLYLQGCDLIPELNGMNFASLPLKLRLRIRRSSVRTIVIKRQSSSFIRYEMFNYDFSFAFESPPGMRGPQPGPAGEMIPGFTPVSEPLPGIFQALREKLGLRLEITRGPVELLIIDHADRVPTDN